MNKNIFLFGFSFLMLLLGLTSCEQELSAEDCLAINAMQVNTTEIKVSDNKQSIIYAFTPSNAKFLNLDYTWSINGQLVEGATNSLFQNTFTENGIFEVCFVAIPKDGSNCVVGSICASVAIDSLVIEEATPIEEVPAEEGNPEEQDCSDITIIASQRSDFNGQARFVVALEPISLVSVTRGDASAITWTVNGVTLSNEELANNGRNPIASALGDFTRINFLEDPGTYTIEARINSPSLCSEGRVLSTTITVDTNSAPTAPTTPEEEGPATPEEPAAPVAPTMPVVEVPVEQGTPVEQDCSDIVIIASQRSDFNGQARFVVALEPISLVSVTRGDASAITWTVNGVILSNEELANNGRNPIASALGDFTRINFLEDPGTYTIEARINSPNLCSEGRVLSTTITVN